MVMKYIFRTTALSTLVVALAAFSSAQDTPEQQQPGQQQIQPQPGVGVVPDPGRGLDPDRERGLDRAEQVSPEGRPRALDQQAARMPFDAQTQGRLNRLQHHYTQRYELEDMPELQRLDRDAANLTWRTWDDAIADWRTEDAYWRLSDQYWRDPARRDTPEARDYWTRSEAYWRDSDMFWRDYLGTTDRQLQTRLRTEGDASIGIGARGPAGPGVDRPGAAAGAGVGAGAGAGADIETDIED